MNHSEPDHLVPHIDTIIQACQKGDRQAQKQLYELFAPRLFALCMRYSRNRMEAEDLLHEGFIKVFTKIEQYKKTGPFEAWIRRLMVNTILESFRKKKKLNLVDESNLPVNMAGDEEEPEGGEMPDMTRVMELINELPERYRMVFNLYVTEGYTHEQIAEEMEISVGTSKSNLSRARQWIKNRLLNPVTNKHESLW